MFAFSIRIAHLQYGKRTFNKKSLREREIRLDAVCVNKGVIRRSFESKKACSYVNSVVDLNFFFIKSFGEAAIIETQSVYYSQNTDLQTSVWIKLLIAMGQESWKQIGLQPPIYT